MLHLKSQSKYRLSIFRSLPFHATCSTSCIWWALFLQDTWIPYLQRPSLRDCEIRQLRLKESSIGASRLYSKRVEKCLSLTQTLMIYSWSLKMTQKQNQSSRWLKLVCPIKTLFSATLPKIMSGRAMCLEELMWVQQPWFPSFPNSALSASTMLTKLQ